MCGCWHGPAAITRSIFVAGSDIGHLPTFMAPPKASTSPRWQAASTSSSGATPGLETCQDRIIFVSPHWPESAPAPGFPIRYRSPPPVPEGEWEGRAPRSARTHEALGRSSLNAAVAWNGWSMTKPTQSWLTDAACSPSVTLLVIPATSNTKTSTAVQRK
jgi:hypothetical protein